MPGPSDLAAGLELNEAFVAAGLPLIDLWT
jgi:hypothetical protein